MSPQVKESCAQESKYILIQNIMSELVKIKINNERIGGLKELILTINIEELK